MTIEPNVYVGKNGVTYQLAESTDVAKADCRCAVPVVKDICGIEYLGYPWWARLLVPSLRGSPGCGCFHRLKSWWDELHIHLESA